MVGHPRGYTTGYRQREEEPMEREPNTYYPGDPITLALEIEHLLNFRWVQAVFRGTMVREGVRTHHEASYSTKDLSQVEDIRPDGTKVTRLTIGERASRNKLIPGTVYELDALKAETVGGLPGESKSGSIIGFDLSGHEKPRFRYEDEVGAGRVVIRSVRLD
jgi:hypothetical protein